jgi:hypothetical protein
VRRPRLDKRHHHEHLQDIQRGIIKLAARTSAQQIAFRYRTIDSTTGATRETAKRLAERLGVDEIQTIHLALHEMAIKLLPQYEADDGPLTAAQIRQMKKQVPHDEKRSVRSSLL